MLAVVDPLTILPIYARLIMPLTPAERKRLALRVAFAVSLALLVSLFVGEEILSFFGITLPSFRIAGGLLLMVMGVQLIYESSASERTAGHDVGENPHTQV